jgi:8-oxo-dGTP diphosphatase
LVDPADRLLLLRIEDPGVVAIGGVPGPPSYWITVGGGLEPDETFEQAGRREVLEETGIEAFELGPALVDRELDLELYGVPTHIFERCFAAWTDHVEISFAGHTELEQDVIKEHRWWELAELSSPDAPTYFPESLTELFQRTIDLRPPDVGRRSMPDSPPPATAD